LADLEAKVSDREMRLIEGFNVAVRGTYTDAYTLDSEMAAELAEANKEHKFALYWAGMQGIGAYIIVGTVRCLFHLCAAMAALFWDEAFVDEKTEQVMSRVQPVFVFTAVLCIWNWSIISQMKTLKAKGALGRKASLKFIGVRFLILVSDGDKSFMHFLSNDLKWIEERDELLLHVCVLSCTCFLVAVWNLLVWKDVPEDRVEFNHNEVDANNPATQPLLG